jgi:hypothetical protein
MGFIESLDKGTFGNGVGGTLQRGVCISQGYVCQVRYF